MSTTSEVAGNTASSLNGLSSETEDLVSPLHRRGSCLPARGLRRCLEIRQLPGSDRRRRERGARRASGVGRRRVRPGEVLGGQGEQGTAEVILTWGTHHGRDQQAALWKVQEADSTRRQDPSSQGVATSDTSPGHSQADRKGYDPVHAAYIFVHHITSVFSENSHGFLR